MYSFGAPGHGKGCFDGVGGTFKNKIHQLIKSTKTSMQGIPGTTSGYIGTVEEVYNALKECFKGVADESRKKARKNPINHYEFFLHKSPDIRRPPNETFVGLENITKNYQFVVTNVGIVHKRNRSCWCIQVADGVPVAPNQYAINVQWYTLRQADSTLEYVIEQSESEPLVNNNKELLHASFPMAQVIGSSSTSARVPRRRNVRSSQSDEFEYDTPASLQTSEGYWFRKECANVWALAQEDKDLALSRLHLL